SFNIVIYILNSCDETKRASEAIKIKQEKERPGKLMQELAENDEKLNIYEKSLNQVKKKQFSISLEERISRSYCSAQEQ
ncbi:MAG: hypothetical protein WA144_11800, partial [Candidatus Methanoperedens sp.]